MSIVDQDILRISANFELGDGTQYQNIYHVIRDGSDPISDAAHVAGIKLKLEDAYTDIAGLVVNDVVEQLSFVDRIDWNATSSQWEVVENIGTFTPTFTPTNANDGLPYQAAPYLVFKTLRPKTVGKKYLFPFAEDQQDQTILAAGAVTAMVAYGVEILTSIPLSPGNTLTFGVPRTGVESWFNFLVAVVNDVIGSQKRRRPGVGA